MKSKKSTTIVIALILGLFLCSCIGTWYFLLRTTPTYEFAHELIGQSTIYSTEAVHDEIKITIRSEEIDDQSKLAMLLKKSPATFEMNGKAYERVLNKDQTQIAYKNDDYLIIIVTMIENIGEMEPPILLSVTERKK